MGFLRKRSKTPGASVQLRSRDSHPFAPLNDYVPLKNGEIMLYRAIREAVPAVDAAVVKLIRLTGGFKVEAKDKTAEKELNEFLLTVPTGRGQQGMDSFLYSYLDSMITCGRGIGEIVLSGDRSVAAILCGNAADIEIREKSSPLDFEICSYAPGGRIVPLPYQNLLLFTPFKPESDNPYGVSLLRSMPFLTEILLKIYNSIGINWDRAGNVRFAVVYKPKNDAVDRAFAKERSEQIAREWSAAMQAGKHGSVRDFVAVGDVDIKVIGADSQILDSEVPVRQIMEQLVAATGLPPFMLGFSWSTTERMSSQQADMITSELTAVRRSLEPVIRRVCDLWLAANGFRRDYTVVWDDINLQDAEGDAHAELYRAQAELYRNQAEKSTGKEV
ncbi:MAG: serine/threonine protein phosphatase [Oscillospiraceae bacterium]|nr:serine/threonine protein phosphatase [Oscillospiraceae bacterium]